MLFFLLSVLFFFHPAEILGWAEFKRETVGISFSMDTEETIPGSWGI